MNYNFSEHIGHSGLLSQKDLDQGDTCQRVGTYYFLGHILGLENSYRDGNFTKDFIMDYIILSTLKSPGKYRRHNNPKASWYDLRQLSRDQKSILMLAMWANGFSKRGLEALKDNAKRFFFHQNTLADDGVSFQLPDVMVPNEFSAAIRGLDLWYLYPILFILDLSFIFEILIFRKSKLWDYDNMLCQQLMFAVVKYPTIISLLAFKIYQKTDFLDRLKAYHKDFSNGIPALYDMFVDANNKLKGEL